MTAQSTQMRPHRTCAAHETIQLDDVQRRTDNALIDRFQKRRLQRGLNNGLSAASLKLQYAGT